MKHSQIAFLLVICISALICIIAAPAKEKATGARIVNGEQASTVPSWFCNFIPYHGTQPCGGVLIAPNVVLTVQHCGPVVGTPVLIHPQRNIQNLDFSPKSSDTRLIQMMQKKQYQAFATAVGAELRFVKRVILHPKYGGKVGVFSIFDCALLVLDKPTTADPAKLPTTAFPPGTVATLYGLGMTDKNQDVFAKDLQKTEMILTPLNSEICRTSSFTESRSVLCATSLKGVACKGDSGSPLVVDNTLVGLASYGPGESTRCGYDSLHRGVDFFTNIATLIPWINHHLRMLKAVAL